jgi:hypothetical protein
MLEASTVPSVCVFPYNEGGVTDVFMYTNASTRLAVTGTNRDVVAAVGNKSGDSAILSPSGTAWPFYWRLSYPADSAKVLFRLARLKFLPPVREVALFYKVKRADTSPSAITNEAVGAGDARDLFADGTLRAPSGWRIDSFALDGTLTPKFDYSGLLNILAVAVTGDGFGHQPDQIDLNWLLLKVTQ